MSKSLVEQLTQLSQQIEEHHKNPKPIGVSKKNDSAFKDGFDSTLEHDQIVWKVAFGSNEREGLLLRTLFATVFWPASVLHQRVYNPIVRKFGHGLIRLACENDTATSEEDPVILGLRKRWMANDIYLLFYAIFVVIAYGYSYCFVVCIGTPSLSFAHLLFLFAIILSFIRVYEIVVFLAVLHTQKQYVTKSSPRALSNTLFHYLEISLAFATLYVGCAWFFNDPFCTPSNTVGDLQTCSLISEQGSWIDPLYFSFVTITTLGYGDFSPQSVIGKILVFAEVFIGIMVLVVVIQRVLSASAELAEARTDENRV